jgi:hypothetical protein
MTFSMARQRERKTIHSAENTVHDEIYAKVFKELILPSEEWLKESRKLFWLNGDPWFI